MWTVGLVVGAADERRNRGRGATGAASMWFSGDRGSAGMTTDVGPLTRDDLRQELDRTLQHYATKADLAALETRLTRWIVALMLGSAGLAAAIAGVIVRVSS